MKYFRLIHDDIDLGDLRPEIDSHSDAWLLNTSRQDKIGVQRDTNNIFLRSAVRRPDLHTNENQETCITSVSQGFPVAMKLLNEFASQMGASLSRATIVRLKPNSQVGVHIDTGSYYLIRDRYHLVIRSKLGSYLRSGNENVRMREGQLWWFDNKQHHFAMNDSDEWRIHLIFDLLQSKYSQIAVNPMPIEDMLNATEMTVE